MGSKVREEGWGLRLGSKDGEKGTERHNSISLFTLSFCKKGTFT